MPARSRGRDKSRDFELVGKVIADKYKVLDVLGQGGFGTVYLVEITAGMVGQRLALKILPADLSRQEAFRTQFLNEIRVAMRLVDRSIVQIRDVGVTEGGGAEGEGLLYYTMDYCPGTTLAEILRREVRLPVTRTLLIVLNVLRALQAAHASGIIHRDLKPANIMVEQTGGKESVRVLDFGIATAITGQGVTTRDIEGKGAQKRRGLAGSPPYMPPEQFLGEAVGFPADIYAAGAILYECITGQKPHPGTTPQEVYRSLRTRKVTPPEELVASVRDYPGLSDLILKCLEKNPERRYQSARELFDTMNATLLGGTTLEPSLEAPGPQPGQLARQVPGGAGHPGAQQPTLQPAQQPTQPQGHALAPGHPQAPLPGPRAPAGRTAPSALAAGPSPAARAAVGRIRRQRAATVAARRVRPKLWPVALATLIMGAVVVAILFHRPIIDWWNQQRLIPGPTAPGPRGSGPDAKERSPALKDAGGTQAGATQAGATQAGATQAGAAQAGAAQGGAKGTGATGAPDDRRSGDGPPEGKAPTTAAAIDDAKKAARKETLARSLQEAREAAERGDWQAASAAAERAVRMDPEDAAANLALAESLAHASPPRLEEAERRASGIRRASPRAPEPVEVLALILEKAGKAAELKALLAESLSAGVESPRIRELHERHGLEAAEARRSEALRLLAEARKALAAGDPAAALDLVRKSLETSPAAEGDILAALCSMELGDLEEGERLAAAALARESPAPEAPAKDALESFVDWFAASRALGGAGPPAAEAIERAEARLARAAGRVSGLGDEASRRLALRIVLARGRARALVGDAAGTAKALEPLERETLKDPSILEEAARIHMTAAKTAASPAARASACLGARRLLVEALRTAGIPAPRRAQLLLLAGICQAELGSFQGREAYFREAIQTLGEAEELGLRTIELYETWSRAYEEVGNLIAAASCLRQVYELDPTPERCLRAVDAYEQASPETARELLRECKERFPESAEVQGR